MSLPVLAAALLFQSMPAPGGAIWEPLGPPRDGVANAIDPASIARTGDSVSIRMRSARNAADPEGMTTAVIGFTIDCRGRTATLDGVDLYKADGSFGRSEEGDDARPVGDDPDQRALFERACRAPAH
jgi:hypothetical protein